MSGFAMATRRGLRATMRHKPAITGQIPAASIYGGTVPADRTFPFSRIGSVIGTPFRASGLNSSSFRIMVQAFTQGVRVASAADAALAIKAEDHANLIGDIFESSLNDATIMLDDGMKLRLTWVQTIATVDGDEPSAWMVTSIFTGEVAG